MKVISFGLWGDDPRYIDGAETNVMLARRFYPGWQLWFFADQTVPKETLNILSRQPDCRVMIADSTIERQHRLFWRFWAAAYDEVEVMLIRDTDSRIGQREQLAVQDWLNRGTGFHIMRDSPQHSVAICGGMWGCYTNRLRNIRQLIEQYYNLGKDKVVRFGVDQDFLMEVIWPIAANDCTEHDEYFAKKPFPYIPRHEKYYVGRAFGTTCPDFQQYTKKLPR
jgi:hypothetical protein